MQARMTHPVMVLPDAMKALLALSKAAQSGTVPDTTHKLIHLRVSQINGCSLCVDMQPRWGRARRRCTDWRTHPSIWRRTCSTTTR